MSKRHICKSKFHVCYHFLDIHENLRRKDFINPHATNILKQLMEIKNGINFIFTLLCGASKRFYLLEAPKRSSKTKTKKQNVPSVFGIGRTRVISVFMSYSDT